MADLFALQDVSDSGKSQTLLQLFDVLAAKYPGARQQVVHRGVEITAILHGAQGHTVGIESQGDPNSRLAATVTALMHRAGL